MVTQAQAGKVGVEEIDAVLLAVASKSRFSSPLVKRAAAQFLGQDINELLASLYLRLQARESKWLTRLIMKSYAPIVIPEQLVFRSYHVLLPDLLKIHAEFSAALHVLVTHPCSSPEFGLNLSDRVESLKGVKPIIGTKIGRQTFVKARSIKHCCAIAQNRCMAIEKKYDGEYCQIHIDLSKVKRDQIKIFSKSGKDSTQDRINVHGVIRKCLGLDDADCLVQRQCILEGELLVYSDKHRRILDFHKIRKHVNRSGQFLGTEKDSQPHPYEHLMIAFFDIMMLDDDIVLPLKHCERFQLLKRVVRQTPGRAILAEQKVIKFSSSTAAADLRRLFARCITSHAEGLIMKPTDDPYFDFSHNWGFRSCIVKLKMEYITGFGDVGDFAVVGAAYDSVKAKTYGIPGLKWTDFYIGALQNKEQVIRSGKKPSFVVVTTISPSREILLSFLQYSTPFPVAFDDNRMLDLRIERGINQGKVPSTIFTKPPVFDIRCFSFDKMPNTGFWTMRFPNVTKLHFDRTYLDTLTFVELQAMAEKSSSTIAGEDSQEDIRWIERLQSADPRGQPVDAVSPSTKRTASTAKSSLLKSASPVVSRAAADAAAVCHTPTPRNTKRRSEEMFGQHSPTFKRAKQAPPKDLTKIQTSLTEQQTRSARPSAGPLSDITNDAERQQPLNRLEFQAAKSLRKIKSNSLPIVKHTPHLPHSATRISLLPTPPSSSSPPRQTSSLSANYKTPQRTASSKTLSTQCFITTNSHNPAPSPKMVPCDLAPAACALSNITFCLSPCIASMPYITENLLPSHGRPYITDAAAWRDTVAFPAQDPTTGVKIRKVLLVEARRKEQTMAVIREVLALDLGRNGLRKELVEIYDWRLLEDVQAAEKGRTVQHNIWRKHWVGAV